MMKMKLSLLLVAAAMCSIPTWAQTRKPTTSKARTTTTRTTTARTTTQKPTQPTEKRWGCYELRASHVSPTDSVIYYLEGEENNAVMSLDCQTGAIKTVIPGIKGIYEGARPLFRNVVATGGKLLVQVRKENKKGVYVWDGKSLSTSKKLPTALEMCAYNGKYLLTYSEPKDKDGCTNYVYHLWDLEKMERELNFPMFDKMSAQTIFHDLDDAVLDSAGNVWFPYEMGVICAFRKERKTVNYQLKGEYIDMLREEDSYGWNSNITRLQISLNNDYIYVCFHRRVFRMSLAQPGTWEEYIKVPPTQQGDFSRICAFPDGSLLTWSDVKQDYATQFYPAESPDSPVNLGDYPKIPIPGGWMPRYAECYLSSHVMFPDCKGNILVNTNNRGYVHTSLDTGDLWVINPRGIKGYKNVVGKVVSMQ